MQHMILIELNTAFCSFKLSFNMLHVFFILIKNKEETRFFDNRQEGLIVRCVGLSGLLAVKMQS